MIKIDIKTKYQIGDDIMIFDRYDNIIYATRGVVSEVSIRVEPLENGYNIEVYYYSSGGWYHESDIAFYDEDRFNEINSK